MEPFPASPHSLTSVISSSSISSFLPSSAPTPNNTFSPPDVFGSRSISRALDGDGISILGLGSEEGIYEQDDRPTRFGPRSPSGGGDTSIQASLTPTSSRYTPSRNPSSFSSHASSRLLPTTTASSIPESIPISSRPIPAPPLFLRVSSTSQSVPLAVGPNSNLAASPVRKGLADSANPFAPRESILSASSPGSLRIEGLKYVEPNSELSTSTSESSRRSKWKMGSTAAIEVDRDTQRLQQLGYDAVLGRDYTFWSSLAISWLNIGCIQGTIYAVSGAYGYGGPMMILIMWPISGFLSLFLTLTLSELASAYPVSGAMASWAWKCARGGVGGERGWGWLMGGVVMGGHVGNILLVAWELVNIVAGTMAIAFEYQCKSWHMVLFFLATILLCGLVGSQAWGRSHRFWLAGGLFGVAIWLVLCISLVATGATRHTSGFITDRFYNESGWDSKAYVFLLGWDYCTIASGADASAHMAEETQYPARNVPNAMTFSMVLTYVLGYISIILLLLSISPDDAATLSEHAFPVGFILTKAVSASGAIAICCLLIFTLLLQILAQLQASSRFVFALARDNAMPFSETIRRTNSKKQPVIANWLVVTLCLPFACLLIGSESTLFSVLATTAGTLSYIGYIVPAGLYLFSGRDLQTEGRTSWSLRRWSKPAAVVGVIYGILVVIVQTLPGKNPVTADSISWSPVAMVGTGIMCLITWKCYGNKHYSGPIRSLTKWETGVEIDLQTTLNSRSRASAADQTAGLDRQTPADDIDTDSALKLPVDDPIYSGGHTVTVESAHTLESGLTSSEWTSATESRDSRASIGTNSTISTRSRPGIGRRGESSGMVSFGSMAGVEELDERIAGESGRG